MVLLWSHHIGGVKGPVVLGLKYVMRVEVMIMMLTLIPYIWEKLSEISDAILNTVDFSEIVRCPNGDDDFNDMKSDTRGWWHNQISTIGCPPSASVCPAGGKHCLNRTPSSFYVNLSSFHTCSMFLHRQIILQVTRRNYNNTIKGMTHKKSYIYIQRSSLQDNFMRPHGQSDDRERDIFSSQADKYTY